MALKKPFIGSFYLTVATFVVGTFFYFDGKLRSAVALKEIALALTNW